MKLAPWDVAHTCNVCTTGNGWLCEKHPDQPFEHDDCPGPGMPCPVLMEALEIANNALTDEERAQIKHIDCQAVTIEPEVLVEVVCRHCGKTLAQMARVKGETKPLRLETCHLEIHCDDCHPPEPNAGSKVVH